MPLSADLRAGARHRVAERSIGAGVAEIVIDPEVPEAARRELEQAPLSALVGFSDPLPDRDAQQDDDTGQVHQVGTERARAGQADADQGRHDRHDDAGRDPRATRASQPDGTPVVLLAGRRFRPGQGGAEADQGAQRGLFKLTPRRFWNLRVDHYLRHACPYRAIRDQVLAYA